MSLIEIAHKKYALVLNAIYLKKHGYLPVKIFFDLSIRIR